MMLKPLVGISQPGAGGQFGQVASGQPGQAHKSLEQVLEEKGFQLPQRPTGPVTQDMVMFGPDPVTGRSRGGGSSESGYYKAVDDFYAQNPEALKIAKQFDSDPGSFGTVQPGLGLPTQTGGGVPPNALLGQLGLGNPMKAMPSASGGLGMGSPDQQTFDPFPAPKPVGLPGLSNLRRDNDMQTMQRGFMPQGNRGGINQFMNFIQSMMQLYQMFNSQGMGGMGGMGGQQGFGGGFGRGMPQMGGMGGQMMGGMRGGYQGYAPPMAPRMQKQTFGGPFGGY